MPQNLKLTPRSMVPKNWVNVQTGWADKQNPAWDSLPADRRADLARRMAVYGAMIDVMDRNIGRVVNHLKQTKQLDNTLIFFLSDNGACAEWDPWGFDVDSGPKNILHTGADLKKSAAPTVISPMAVAGPTLPTRRFGFISIMLTKAASSPRSSCIGRRG